MSLGRKFMVAGLTLVGVGFLLGVTIGLGRDDSKALYFDLIGALVGIPVFVIGYAIEGRAQRDRESR